MVEWLVKKVLVGKINRLLKDYKGNAATVRETLRKWTERISKVLACFQSALARLEDNELTADEIKETAEEIQGVIKAW